MTTLLENSLIHFLRNGEARKEEEKRKIENQSIFIAHRQKKQVPFKSGAKRLMQQR